MLSDSVCSVFENFNTCVTATLHSLNKNYAPLLIYLEYYSSIPAFESFSNPVYYNNTYSANTAFTSGIS